MLTDTSNEGAGVKRGTEGLADVGSQGPGPSPVPPEAVGRRLRRGSGATERSVSPPTAGIGPPPCWQDDRQGLVPAGTTAEPVARGDTPSLHEAPALKANEVLPVPTLEMSSHEQLDCPLRCAEESGGGGSADGSRAAAEVSAARQQQQGATADQATPPNNTSSFAIQSYLAGLALGPPVSGDAVAGTPQHQALLRYFTSLALLGPHASGEPGPLDVPGPVEFLLAQAVSSLQPPATAAVAAAPAAAGLPQQASGGPPTSSTATLTAASRGQAQCAVNHTQHGAYPPASGGDLLTAGSGLYQPGDAAAAQTRLPTASLPQPIAATTLIRKAGRGARSAQGVRQEQEEGPPLSPPKLPKPESGLSSHVTLSEQFIEPAKPVVAGGRGTGGGRWQQQKAGAAAGPGQLSWAADGAGALPPAPPLVRPVQPRTAGPALLAPSATAVRSKVGPRAPPCHISGCHAVPVAAPRPEYVYRPTYPVHCTYLYRFMPTGKPGLKPRTDLVIWIV